VNSVKCYRYVRGYSDYQGKFYVAQAYISQRRTRNDKGLMENVLRMERNDRILQIHIGTYVHIQKFDVIIHPRAYCTDKFPSKNLTVIPI
jgi:hypothetical protein